MSRSNSFLIVRPEGGEWESLQPLPPEWAQTSRKPSHLGWSKPAISNPRPPGSGSLCGPYSHHPFHPLPTQARSHKQPLTPWIKFHWPSFVGSSLPSEREIFKVHLLGFFLKQGGGWRHTGRASAIYSTTSAGAQAMFNDIFVPSRKSLLGSTAPPLPFKGTWTWVSWG